MKRIIIILAVLLVAFLGLACSQNNKLVMGPDLETGNITVEVGPASLNQQLVMGTTDQKIVKIKITASTDVVISEIPLCDCSTGWGTLEPLCLYDEDDGSKISGPVLFLYGPKYAVVRFSGMNLNIPAGSTKTLIVQTNVATAAGGAKSGSVHNLIILADEPIVASNSSGQPVAVNYKQQIARPLTVYRTKLFVEWASDSPSGLSIGSFGQIIAKFKISNIPNEGNYSAIVKCLNLSLSGSIKNTNSKVLAIYADSLDTSPLATTTWFGSGNLFGDTSISYPDMTDIEIEPGQTVTIIVTLDTDDAHAGDFLEVGFKQRSIFWSCGGLDDIIAEVDALPPPKRLTY